MIVSKEFVKFLTELDLEAGGCAVCEDVDGRYYFIVKTDWEDSVGWTVNDRLFYDYSEKWENDGKNWRVLWKRVKKG